MNLTKFGQFLKQTRQAHGLTQADLAKHLGITPQAVSKWERGENMPDVTFFPDLSALYNLPIDTLLTAEQLEPETLSPADFSMPLFDPQRFETILHTLEHATTCADTGLSFDFFPYLGKTQKTRLMSNLLKKPDYVAYLDDILPYATTTGKSELLGIILADANFEAIELILPFLNNEMKQTVLNNLLYSGQFDLIEDLIVLFNKKHRESILQFFLTNQTDADRIDNFVPFFDKSQLRQLKRR